MLVLTRKKNEAIVIDDTIKVTVLEVKGKSIRLGITAPPEIPVHRAEVQRQIDEFSFEVRPAEADCDLVPAGSCEEVLLTC